MTDPVTVQPTRDQLRALANAATEGPWLPHARYVWTSELGGIIQNWSDDANAAADMEFIAAARNALPHLLDQSEAELDYWMARAYEAEQREWRAEARIKAVREALDGYGKPTDRIGGLPDAIRRALDGEA